MDRLQDGVGFRVHAHALRHTFATVATKLGWNLEHLRAAMGHADYKVLQHYVRLATERDLGSRRDWLESSPGTRPLSWILDADGLPGRTQGAEVESVTGGAGVQRDRLRRRSPCAGMVTCKGLLPKESSPS